MRTAYMEEATWETIVDRWENYIKMYLKEIEYEGVD
jgi:hypothetical protein